MTGIDEFTMADQHRVRLSEGFTLRDVTGDGAQFSVMPSNMNEAEMEPARNAFDGEVRLDHVRTDILVTESDTYSSPFEFHSSVMENVTSDGSVKKKIVRTGTGIVVPPNAIVTFHYNAYVEYNDEPFDSTVLQGKPFCVKLNNGGLLPGLELGLLTMRKSEKADFLVQPRMAYGPRGCPPRIPPNSEILFDVELIDWTITPGSESIEATDKLHLSDSDWEKAKAQAEHQHLEGNDHFKKKNYHKALRAYRSAEKIVGTSRLKNDEEEIDHNKFLVKLHTNMAICYYELKNFSDVCIHCKEAITLNPTHPKAHYFWGLALTGLNEFSLARSHLLKAKRASNDKAINNALNMLEERVRSCAKQEKMMWTRAVNPTGKSEKCLQNQNAKTASSIWKDQLTAFKDSPNEKQILLPGGVDDKELDALIADVEALKLKVDITPSSICIFKEEN